MRVRERTRRFADRLDRRLPLPGARHRFRDWRRARPFGGGLLLVLAGAELLLVPLSPIPVLVSLGLGGIAAIAIGLALIAAGVFLWVLPHTRHYVSVNALILSVVAFAATNLGGFLVGTALGILGSALGFGWTPADEPVSKAGADGVGEAGSGPTAPRALAVLLPAALLAAAAVTTGGGRAEAAPGGPPPASRTPPTITAEEFRPQGFIVAGVREIPTVDGTQRVMVLRMRAASLRDYRMTTRDGAPRLALGAGRLDLRGDVTLYLTRFHGCVEGLICLTFTPDRLPVPPLVPPFVFLTDVTAEQALVTSDTITAQRLVLRAS
ncbi:DUF6114 domain-containing protein [Streptomyces sp. NPDC049837]|uniref:DUF6114 domain-containing protein n=1 Tax=Streptomyces sp. NPDC049837 TaxID=3155277 RepID=UPI00342939DC